MVEALRFKPEGRGFYWNFSLISKIGPHYGPEVDSVFNRNEFQGYLLGVKAAGV